VGANDELTQMVGCADCTDVADVAGVAVACTTMIESKSQFKGSRAKLN
jgi:hypothetical protein